MAIYSSSLLIACEFPFIFLSKAVKTCAIFFYPEINSVHIPVLNPYNFSVTEEGLYGVSTRTVSKEDTGVLLLGGTFFGLAVQAPDGDCPLILTTSASSESTSLLVIGKNQLDLHILQQALRMI